MWVVQATAWRTARGNWVGPCFVPGFSKQPGFDRELFQETTMSKRKSLVLLPIAAIVVAVAAPAQAQLAGGDTIQSPQAVWNNSNAGAVAQRSPGNMVAAGVARAQLTNRSASPHIQITETGGELSPGKMFLIDAIGIIFSDLNLAIVAIHNVILAQAGEPPVIPASILPDLGGTDGGGLDLGGIIDQLGGVFGAQ